MAKTGRCRSWRPILGVDITAEISAPGSDRAQWEPCRNKTSPDQYRCETCTELLLTHPSETVRLMLATEVGIGRRVLERLINDPSAVVEAAAHAGLVGEFPPENLFHPTTDWKAAK